MKVLIADDSPLIRDVIRRFLEKSFDNPVIIECSDGDETVAIQRNEKPDLILMDIMMVRMDGLEAIRQIKKHSPLSRIIVISQLPEEEYKQAALDAGALDYLNKENLTELKDKIKRVTENKTKYGESI